MNIIKVRFNKFISNFNFLRDNDFHSNFLNYHHSLILEFFQKFDLINYLFLHLLKYFDR